VEGWIYCHIWRRGRRDCRDFAPFPICVEPKIRGLFEILPPKPHECHMSRDVEPMPHCECSGPEGHAGIATCLRSSRTIFSAISAANDGLLRTVEAKRTQPDLLALRPACTAHRPLASQASGIASASTPPATSPHSPRASPAPTSSSTPSRPRRSLSQRSWRRAAVTTRRWRAKCMLAMTRALFSSP
jgi:cell division septation protein DedD